MRSGAMATNDPSGKNREQSHYRVLGVARTATAEKIQSAYRRLAKDHHPDRAGAESTAVFQEIVEAYRVLSDPESRRRHDRDLAARELRHRIRAKMFVQRTRPATAGPGPEPLVPNAAPRRPARGPVPEPLVPGRGPVPGHGPLPSSRRVHGPEAQIEELLSHLLGLGLRRRF